MDRDGKITTIERDGSGKPKAIVGPFGQRTELTVDANGYLKTITDPANGTYQLITTSDGLLTQFTDPKNNSSQFTYDALGRLTKDEDPLTASSSLVRIDIPDGFNVTFKDALNRTTLYQDKFFDSGEEQRLNTFPDGTQRSLNIRPDWSMSSVEPDGTTMDILRSADPRFGMGAPVLKQQIVHTPGGLVSTVETTRSASLLDPNNIFSFTNQTETLRLNGKNYTSVFDPSARTWTSSTPEGRSMVATLNNKERISQQQVPGIEPVLYSYDPQGRLVHTSQGTSPDERTIDMTYNPEGFLKDITNTLGEKVSFLYDLKGRVTDQTLPDGRVIHYTYDANDNVTSITPPGRPAHAFDYTPLDLESQYTPPDVNPGSDATLYSYNAARQINLITRPDGATIDFNYDTAGRLGSVIVPNGQ